MAGWSVEEYVAKVDHFRAVDVELCTLPLSGRELRELVEAAQRGLHARYGVSTPDRLRTLLWEYTNSIPLPGDQLFVTLHVPWHALVVYSRKARIVTPFCWMEGCRNVESCSENLTCSTHARGPFVQQVRKSLFAESRAGKAIAVLRDGEVKLCGELFWQESSVAKAVITLYNQRSHPGKRQLRSHDEVCAFVACEGLAGLFGGRMYSDMNLLMHWSESQSQLFVKFLTSGSLWSRKCREPDCLFTCGTVDMGACRIHSRAPDWEALFFRIILRMAGLVTQFQLEARHLEGIKTSVLAEPNRRKHLTKAVYIGVTPNGRLFLHNGKSARFLCARFDAQKCPQLAMKDGLYCRGCRLALNGSFHAALLVHRSRYWWARVPVTDVPRGTTPTLSDYISHVQSSRFVRASQGPTLLVAELRNARGWDEVNSWIGGNVLFLHFESLIHRIPVRMGPGQMLIGSKMWEYANSLLSKHYGIFMTRSSYRGPYPLIAATQMNEHFASASTKLFAAGVDLEVGEECLRANTYFIWGQSSNSLYVGLNNRFSSDGAGGLIISLSSLYGVEKARILRLLGVGSESVVSRGSGAGRPRLSRAKLKQLQARYPCRIQAVGLMEDEAPPRINKIMETAFILAATLSQEFATERHLRVGNVYLSSLQFPHDSWLYNVMLAAAEGLGEQFQLHSRTQTTLAELASRGKVLLVDTPEVGGGGGGGDDELVDDEAELHALLVRIEEQFGQDEEWIPS